MDSACRRRLMASLELDRCEHTQRRVSTLAVVNDLQVLEDGVGQLDACPVEHLDLHAAPERFHERVVEAIADRFHRRSKPESMARRVNAQDVNCVPWSLWMMVSSLGRRCSMAMPSALVTRAALGLASIDQR